MNKRNKIIMMAGFIILAAGLYTGCGGKNPLDPESPVSISVWNYYSGYQQIAFDEMISEFNSTEGIKKGIIVNSVAQGSIDGLVDEIGRALKDPQDGRQVPNIVCIYADTAYELDKQGVLVSLDSYYSKEELDQFIPSFIEEGRLTKGGDLKLIPISKSTEILMYNKTDFDQFAKDTGSKPEDMSTLEGLARTAEKYYNWTDEKTPDIPEDGKAFYGRDSMENYMMLGAARLGHPILTLDENGGEGYHLDRDTIYTLWKNYYIPYINGYYGAYGRFRSDDAKIGKIVAAVCSSSGISFFPHSVTMEDDAEYEIEAGMMEAPGFEGGNELQIQQGASYGVIRSDEAAQYASVEFLKWLNKKEQNMKFAIGANYMPVTKEAFSEKELDSFYAGRENTAADNLFRESLKITSVLVEENRMWYGDTCDKASPIRSFLGKEIEDKAKEDREAVLAKIKQGLSREEAVSSFISEKSFDNWYQELKSGMDRIIQDTSQN